MVEYRGYDAERRFMEAWQRVRIARPVHYTLFTFGESELPYYLVLEPEQPGKPVSVRQGMVKIARPLIITPDTIEPEFQNFFESDDEADVAQFLLARAASFSHLRLQNQLRGERIATDNLQTVIDHLNRQLDDEDEDRVAILAAPAALAGIAVLKYAADRVASSAAGNITELREKGFLPD